MPNYRVIALDPGGTTGWATYSATRIMNPWGENEYFDETWNSGYIEGSQAEQARQFDTLLGTMRIEIYVVVIERFVRRRDNKGAEDVALEHEAYIKQWCEANNVPYVLNMPSDKKFAPDPVLKRLGLWIPGRTWRHSMDSYRHLVHYLCTKVVREDILAKAFPR